MPFSMKTKGFSRANPKIINKLKLEHALIVSYFSEYLAGAKASNSYALIIVLDGSCAMSLIHD